MAEVENQVEDDIVIPGVDRTKLPEHVALRTPAGGVLILIGTAHLSEESSRDVATAIQTVNPQLVMIELCPARIDIIDPQHVEQLYLQHRRRKEEGKGANGAESNGIGEDQRGEEENGEGKAVQRRTERDVDPENETGAPEASQEDETAETGAKANEGASNPRRSAKAEGEGRLKNIGNNLKRPGGMLAVALGYMYETVSGQVKLEVGGDMRTAAEEAAKIGATIVLGDRPIGITIARAWGGLSMWEKCKLAIDILKLSFSSIKAEDIEMLKNQDILTELSQELSKQYPSLHTHLLVERDLYLAFKLRSLSAPLIVGVVGKGHVQGIQKHWEAQIDIEAISKTPPSSSWKAFFAKVVIGLTVVCGSTIGLIQYLRSGKN